MISDRLLTDAITIKKPAQSNAPGTLRPVFRHDVVATGVRARFDPVSVALHRGVLGQVPKKAFRIFLNPTEIAENYQIVRESDGKEFVVTEVLDMFAHHLEAMVEERQ